MSGFLSQNLIEQVRSANDIVDVIGGAIPLKRAGLNFTALCPFHREKTPSFNVNPRKQIFRCFGCGKGGDVFTFVREYEGLDFVEAVKRLAERARIPLQFDNDPAAKERTFIKDKLFEIHEQITNYWHAMLKNDGAGERAREYLKERGVTPEAVDLFRLGFAPTGWDDSVNWARGKGYTPETLAEGGLLVQREEKSGFYGRFRGRLMFPIADEQGRVIGFSGRVLPGDDDERKYVNSPETPLFLKSKVMFGLDKSKRALLEKESAIICEGQLDLIACFMAGVQNVVAPQGTAFTADHARILKRYVKEVVLCFDSDNAGQKATVRVLDHLLGSGLATRVATVPAPHDPDSFIKANGAEAFRELISKAESFFDHYLNWLCSTNDIASDRGQQEVVRAMAEATQKAGDPFLTDRYARKTAARLGVSTTNARAAFGKRGGARAQARSGEEGAEGFDPEDRSWRPNAHEFWLLKLVFFDEQSTAWVAEHLDLEWIQNLVVRQILEQGIYPDAEGRLPSAASLVQRIDDPRAQSLLTEALAEEREIKNAQQQLNDLILKLRNATYDREIVALAGRAEQSGIDDEAKLQLLQEQLRLRQAKNQPLQPM